jgi:ParB family chromosome partitioning protein
MTAIHSVPGPEAEEVRLIPIAAIKVADRIRPVDPGQVEFLRLDILAHGLLTRIEVCHEGAGYRLVAGAHRLAACTALAWEEIPAIVRDHEALGRRQREISENLVRHELNVLDRAAHIGELVMLQMQAAGLDPEESARKIAALKRHGKKLPAQDLARLAKNANATVAFAYPMQEELAEQVGLSLRTITRDLQIYRNLSPRAAEALRGTRLVHATTELLALSKEEPATQLTAAEMIANGAAKSAGEAIATLTGQKKPKPADQAVARLAKAFGALSARDKARALELMVQHALPKGYAITTPNSGHGHD